MDSIPCSKAKPLCRKLGFPSNVYEWQNPAIEAFSPAHIISNPFILASRLGFCVDAWVEWRTQPQVPGLKYTVALPVINASDAKPAALAIDPYVKDVRATRVHALIAYLNPSRDPKRVETERLEA